MEMENITDIKKEFEKRECKLLSSEYINARSFLEYVCKCGNIEKSTLYNFRNGEGCRKCRKIMLQKNKNNLYEFSSEIFNKHNSKLLSIKISGSSDIVDYVCECGNKAKIRLSRFLAGSRCKKCANNKVGKANKKRDIESIKLIFEERKCKLLSTKYLNTETPLEYICVCGNKSVVKIYNFLRNKGCKNCAVIRMRENFFNNGIVPCSIQQKYVYSASGGILNYNFSKFNLDICVDKVNKIYIEYDGSGHDMAVRMGKISIKDLEKKERKRFFYLKNNGWKCIRIVSKKDKLPLFKILKKHIIEAIKYIKDGHSSYTIDYDKMNIDCKLFSKKIECDLVGKKIYKNFL